MTAPFSLRPMTSDDLPAVNALQTQAYSAKFHESPASFAAKQRFCPEGAWVAVIGRQVVGYLFSHPWYDDRPAPLDAELSAAKSPDCYYLHDITVAKSQRGQGIAAAFVAKGEGLAKGLGFQKVAMTSVQGSQPIWEKFGYHAVALQGEAKEKLQSYGADAVYLVKSL